MSTKTIKQRIALVAVSALTAGVLSVASAPVASANGVLSSTVNSVGVLAGTSIVSGTTTTHTATMLSSGTLMLTYGGASSVVVSAGARISSASTTANIAASQQAAYNVTAVGIVATGAVGSTFTVSGYSQVTAATVAVATPTSVMTVTIAASSVAGVPAVSESTFRWAADNSTAPTAAESVDNSTDDYASNNLFLYIDLEDAYGADIEAAGGALVVTASSGATVGNPASSGATSGVTNVGILSTDPSTVWAVVKSATTGAPWTGTVTVAYNGVTLATLSGSITGAPNKLTLTPYKAGKTGNNAAGFLYKVTDAAGNGLAFTSANLSLDNSSDSSVVATAAGGSTDAADGGSYGDYIGDGNFTCAKSGTSNVSMSLVIPGTATVIKSTPVALRCAGQAHTYTASFDKASYVQGEIATLTVTYRDSSGNLANSYDAVDAVSGGATNASISTPMMSLVGFVNSAANAATIKPGINGTRTYTFTVGGTTGVTAGSYNAVVTFPTVLDRSVTKAATVAYQVTTGGSSVTNEDVLKSIVSLIASINKQIQALQKLILRR
jgi:hypothetical protein